MEDFANGVAKGALFGAVLMVLVVVFWVVVEFRSMAKLSRIQKRRWNDLDQIDRMTIAELRQYIFSHMSEMKLVYTDGQGKVRDLTYAEHLAFEEDYYLLKQALRRIKNLLNAQPV